MRIVNFYLLDTGIISILYDPRREKHSDVRSAIESLGPASPQFLSVVVLAELLFGLCMAESTGQELAHIRSTIERAQEREIAEIGRHTAESYGNVKSQLALHWTNPEAKRPRWPEDWKDRVTAKSLKIDENDLWLVAQAVEGNYVLLTTDKKLADQFEPAVPDLRLCLI